MRSLALFVAVAVMHFALSVAGVVVALPAAFDMQAGEFWATPGKATLAWLAGILLAPLALARPFLPPGGPGYVEIGAVSALFGAAAVAIYKVRSSRHE
jgi:hypothetical protein